MLNTPRPIRQLRPEASAPVEKWVKFFSHTLVPMRQKHGIKSKGFHK